MYYIIEFVILCSILFAIKFMHKRYINKSNSSVAFRIDYKVIGAVYSIIACVFVFVFVYIDCLIYIHSKENGIAFILCESSFIALILFIGILYDRSFIEFSEECISIQKLLNKKKDYFYKDISYYIIDEHNRLNVYFNNNTHLLIPQFDNALIIDCFFINKNIKNNSIYDADKTVMRASRLYRVISLIVLGLAIFVVIVSVCLNSGLGLLFGAVYFVCSFLTMLSRYQDRIIISNKIIICKRIFKKTIIAELRNIKKYREKNNDGVKIIELILSDDSVIKVNMLWENSHIINSLIKKHKWKLE